MPQRPLADFARYLQGVPSFFITPHCFATGAETGAETTRAGAEVDGIAVAELEGFASVGATGTGTVTGAPVKVAMRVAAAERVGVATTGDSRVIFNKYSHNASRSSLVMGSGNERAVRTISNFADNSAIMSEAERGDEVLRYYSIWSLEDLTGNLGRPTIFSIFWGGMYVGHQL